MINKGWATKLGLSNLINAIFSKKHRNETKINKQIQKQTEVVLKRGKKKIFVIGFNKTGTTSIGFTLRELGFILAGQGPSELLLGEVIEGNYNGLDRVIVAAEVFQDIPYSLPNVYKELYKRYPDAYFILSHRDSAEQWFSSLLEFHKIKYGNGAVPTEEILKSSFMHYTGYPWQYINYCFDSKVYEEEYYKKVYENHMFDVKEFFKKNDGKLCVINVSSKKDYFKLCEFLGVKATGENFLWKNKTMKK